MSKNSQLSTIKSFKEWLGKINPKSDILQQPVANAEVEKKPYKIFKKFR